MRSSFENNEPEILDIKISKIREETLNDISLACQKETILCEYGPIYGQSNVKSIISHNEKFWKGFNHKACISLFSGKLLNDYKKWSKNWQLKKYIVDSSYIREKMGLCRMKMLENNVKPTRLATEINIVKSKNHDNVKRWICKWSIKELECKKEEILNKIKSERKSSVEQRMEINVLNNLMGKRKYMKSNETVLKNKFYTVVDSTNDLYKGPVISADGNDENSSSISFLNEQKEEMLYKSLKNRTNHAILQHSNEFRLDDEEKQKKMKLRLDEAHVLSGKSMFYKLALMKDVIKNPFLSVRKKLCYIPFVSKSMNPPIKLQPSFEEDLLRKIKLKPQKLSKMGKIAQNFSECKEERPSSFIRATKVCKKLDIINKNVSSSRYDDEFIKKLRDFKNESIQVSLYNYYEVLKSEEISEKTINVSINKVWKPNIKRGIFRQIRDLQSEIKQLEGSYMSKNKKKKILHKLSSELKNKIRMKEYNKCYDKNKPIKRKNDFMLEKTGDNKRFKQDKRSLKSNKKLLKSLTKLGTKEIIKNNLNILIEKKKKEEERIKKEKDDENRRLTEESIKEAIKRSKIKRFKVTIKRDDKVDFSDFRRVFILKEGDTYGDLLNILEEKGYTINPNLFDGYFENLYDITDMEDLGQHIYLFENEDILDK